MPCSFKWLLLLWFLNQNSVYMVKTSYKVLAKFNRIGLINRKVSQNYFCNYVLKLALVY